LPEKIGRRIILTSVIGALGGLGYLMSNWVGLLWGAWEISFDFEKNIPFVPGFVYFYVLVYPLLVSPVFTVKKYEDFLDVILGYSVLIAVSLAIFMTLPTRIERPEHNLAGFAGWLFNAIYTVDGPCNLFPSLHVSSSVYISFTNGYFCPKLKWISWLIAILISISTILIKQHAIIDVAGGVGFGAVVYIFIRILRAQERSF